jgi:hypothetical protein
MSATDEMIDVIATAKTRNDVVWPYAAFASRTDVDWKRINQTITERWSKSGLAYIKRRAWMVRGDLAEIARQQQAQ